MNWLTRLVGHRAETDRLAPTIQDALRRWAELPAADLSKPHFETRYVVLNTEASGLNLDKDRLLAIGAVAIEGAQLSPQASHYVSLTQDPAAGLAELLTFGEKGPIVVYNATFNRTLIERAFLKHLGITPDWLWIDLYWLLPGLYEDYLDRPCRLADWMRAFDIETFQRHHGLGEAWAVAQLMLAAQSRALLLGVSSPRSLSDLERMRRQLMRQA